MIGLGVSLGGPTGYAINPARDLGPRLAHALLPILGRGHPIGITPGCQSWVRSSAVSLAPACISCWVLDRPQAHRRQDDLGIRAAAVLEAAPSSALRLLVGRKSGFRTSDWVAVRTEAGSRRDTSGSLQRSASTRSPSFPPVSTSSGVLAAERLAGLLTLSRPLVGTTGTVSRDARPCRPQPYSPRPASPPRWR